MEIVVRPLNVNTWAGVAFFKNCKEDLAPYLYGMDHPLRGQRYTGFESANEEEHKELEKLRKQMEKKINTDLSQNSIYWDNFFVRMKSEDLVLHPDKNPLDELKYIFLRRHKDCKIGLSTHKAGAKYVILDEDVEAKRVNTSMSSKIKAFNAFDDMTGDDARDALRLFGVRGEELKDSVAKARIAEYIERDPDKFIKIWVDNKDRKTYIIIEKAISRGVVRRTNLMYIYGTINMGKTIEDVVAFLNSDSNQEIYLGIQTALK